MPPQRQPARARPGPHPQQVVNQKGVVVQEYTPLRLVKGRNYGREMS